MTGDEIRKRREQLGMSQESLARAVGTSQQTIQRIESAITINSYYRDAIIDFFAKPDEKYSERLRRANKRHAVAERSANVEIERFGEGKDGVGNNKAFGNLLTNYGELIPVYAPYLNSDGEFELNNLPANMIKRPEPLHFASNAYALYVADDRLYPALKVGDIALVNPNIPPLIGEEHIFLTEATAESNQIVVVGTLDSYTSFHFEIRQFNPPEAQTLGRNLYGVCHRIVGKFSRS